MVRSTGRVSQRLFLWLKTFGLSRPGKSEPPACSEKSSCKWPVNMRQACLKKLWRPAGSFLHSMWDVWEQDISPCTCKAKHLSGSMFIYFLGVWINQSLWQRYIQVMKDILTYFQTWFLTIKQYLPYPLISPFTLSSIFLSKKMKSLLIFVATWGTLVRLSRCAWKIARFSHRKEHPISWLSPSFISELAGFK